MDDLSGLDALRHRLPNRSDRVHRGCLGRHRQLEGRRGRLTLGSHVNETFGTILDIPKYTFLIFGVILLVTMLFRPEGLFPEARRKAEFEQGVQDEPLYDTQQT